MPVLNYEFLSVPSGSVYRYLLDFASLYSKTFGLVLRNSIGLEPSGSECLSRMEPWCLKTEKRSSWPGTLLLDGSTADIFLYRVTPETMNIVKNQVDALYKWQQPQYPEDLFFLRANQEPFLMSIAHEQYCALSLEARELEHLKRSFSNIFVNLKLSIDE